MKTLLTTQIIKFIDKKKFVTAELDANNEIFMANVAVLDIRGINMAIYPF